MSAAHNRRLRQLMADHNLSDDQVGALVHRTAAYVRELREDRHPCPAPTLRLLELELKERTKQAAAVEPAFAAQG
jgi:hypothetical protein